MDYEDPLVFNCTPLSLTNGVQGTHNLIKKVVGHCLLYCPNHSCAINTEVIVPDSFAEPEGPNDLGFLIVQEVVRQFNGIVADAVSQCCLNGIQGRQGTIQFFWRQVPQCFLILVLYRKLDFDFIGILLFHMIWVT